MSTPAAGWYDDPSDPSLRRWWDGSAWTHDTQSRSDGPVAGWYDDPETPGTRRWWDGVAWGETEGGLDAEGLGAAGDELRTDGLAATVVDLRDVEPAAAEQSAPVFVAATASDERGVDESTTQVVAAALAAAAGQSIAERDDAVPDAPSSITAGDESTGPSATLRRVVVVVALAAVVVAVAGWFVWQKVSTARLAEPASTAAEAAWVDAGTSLGEAALQQAIASDRLDAYCEGTYATIAGSGDGKLAGVAPDRARSLFTSACLSVARGLPTSG